MEFKQFIRRLEEAEIDVTWKTGRPGYQFNYSSSKVEGAKPYLYTSWCAGGLTGGSCWGGSADTAISSEPEPEFNDLDKVFELFWPDIPFIKYKVLVPTLMQRGDYCSNDYYGNYTNYAYKAVDIEALFQVFHENGKL